MPSLNAVVPQIASTTTAFLSAGEGVFALALGIPLAFLVLRVLVGIVSGYHLPEIETPEPPPGIDFDDSW